MDTTTPQDQNTYLAFGPVWSRRLGTSLGINNIPPKQCSYSCVYCQVGRTRQMRINRKFFYTPAEIQTAVETRLAEIPDHDEIDYITLVPDGEPTLDIYLDETIPLLKSLGYRVAVITNGSLLWRKDVRYDLQDVDWISIKIDTVSESTWHKINRPHSLLEFDKLLRGIADFASTFRGTLTTETMMVRGLNDSFDELTAIRDLLTGLAPDITYLAIPTRPPAESWVEIPEAGNLNMGYQLLSERLRVELLTGLGNNSFSPSGDISRDLLSITAVHPMPESAVQSLLQMEAENWQEIEQLLNSGQIRRVLYRNQYFYLRNFQNECC